MRYQMDSQNAGEMESSFYVELDRNPETNPAIFVDCSDLPSMTRQEFADDADINTLMAKYETTGVMSGALAKVQGLTPQYLDLEDVPDLQTSFSILEEAKAAFMRLPATTRREFDNDPFKFVDFASDPKNVEKMREWGLAAPLPVEPVPQKVEIINLPDDKSGDKGK